MNYPAEGGLLHPVFQYQVRHLLKLSHIIRRQYCPGGDGVPGARHVVRTDRRADEAQRHLNFRGHIHRGAIPRQDGIEAGTERVNQLHATWRDLWTGGAKAHLGVGDGRDHDTVTAQHRLLLKLKLLNRTTRSLTQTEAGERLIQLTGPALEKIVVGLEQLKELWDKPAGRIRLSADEYAIQYFLWPKLAPVLKEYPNIHLELITDYGLIDIARERFDAGARRGGLIA